MATLWDELERDDILSAYRVNSQSHIKIIPIDDSQAQDPHVIVQKNELARPGRDPTIVLHVKPDSAQNEHGHRDND